MKKIGLICIISMIVSMLPGNVMASEMGNVYYVSTTGSDRGDGTIDNPFKTISHAAGVMSAGDTCFIRGGIYRECVDIKNKGTESKPVTFKAYNGEKVEITGTDVLDSGWEKYKDNIYFTKMDWSLDSGNSNMIFVDGKMQQEAKWPNITDELDINQYARPNWFSNGVITDFDIPNIDMSGALLWYRTNKGYWSFTGSVISNSKGTANVTYETSLPMDSTSIYYMARKLELLDSEGEWYLDEAEKKLYLYAPGGANPENFEVTAQKRKNAIVFSDAKYVNVEDIYVWGGNIVMSDATEHCVLDNMNIKSASYTVRKPSSGSGSCNSQGVIIKGRNNTIKNSEISENFGDGICVEGSNNTVFGCEIHDFNYENTYSYGVGIYGKNHLVKNNSIYRTGRSAIGGEFKACEISYNNISDTMNISKDGGALYLCDYDFGGSEIHHNTFSNQKGEGFSVAIYYDNCCSNIITYNNVVFANDNSYDIYPLDVNNPNEYNLFFNNTFIGDLPIHSWGTGAMETLYGNVFVNNLFTTGRAFDAIKNMPGFVKRNNVMTTKSMLNSDGTLKSTNGAIDAGIYIPHITEEYGGAAPDCGAFEYGNSTLGNDLDRYNEKLSLNYNIAFANVLENPGFEDGLEGWKIESGNPLITTQNAWANTYNPEYVRRGNKCLQIKTGDTVSKKVTGLVPDSEYKIAGYGKLAGAFTRAIDFDEVSSNFVTYPGEEFITGLADGKWAKYKNIDFEDGGYDLVTYKTKDSSSATNTITMCVDSIDNPVSIETVSSSSSGTKSTFALNKSISGIHDVYIKFSEVESSGVQFGGFALDSSINSDSAKMIVITDSGDRKEIEMGASQWEVMPEEVTVKTGKLGEIEIYLEKTSGSKSLYLDDFGVAQIFGNTVRSSDFYIDNVKLKTLNNKGITKLSDEEVNVFEAEVVNSRNETADYLLEYICYNYDGTVYSEVKTEIELEAKEKKKFGMGTFASVDGAYLKIKVYEDNDLVGGYDITPVSLFNYNAESDKMLKIESAWIKNSLDTQKFEANLDNTIHLNFKNNSGDSITANCIVALYDQDMRLVSVATEEKTFNAYSSDYCNCSLGNKSNGEKYAKIMIFEQNTITPLTDVFKLY